MPEILLARRQCMSVCRRHPPPSPRSSLTSASALGPPPSELTEGMMVLGLNHSQNARSSLKLLCSL